MIHKTTLCNAILATALLAGPLTSAASAQDADTSFFDGFDKLDTSRWFVSDGWTNGAHQGCDWSKDHVAVDGGMLHLKITDKPGKGRPMSCGEIQTRKNFGYGTYEVRMRAANGSGLNTAFFSYSGAPSKTPHDEVDFEFLGKNSATVQLNYYVNAKGGHEYLAPVAGGADQGFHDYAFVWAADRIRWYIDGKLVHQELPSGPMPTHPAKIFLSLWNGTARVNGWLGPFAYPGKPITADFDWVAFTPAGQSCKFPDSLLCKTDITKIDSSQGLAN